MPRLLIIETLARLRRYEMKMNMHFVFFKVTVFKINYDSQLLRENLNLL